MDAVVFDFDGVIIASMEAHADAYAKVLNPLGADVSARDVLLREGARSETIIRDLLGAAGIATTEAQVAELANAKQQAFLAGPTPQLYPDAVTMLESVWQHDVKTAIVTGTRRANLDALIPDLAPKFDAIITQESYSQDKPHPEPYLAAAAALGLDPANCIAVENAIRGVQSATAAGYGAVAAITTTLAAADLLPCEPNLLCADHESLTAALLEQL